MKMEKIHLFVDRSFLGKQRIVDLCESDEEMQKMTVLQLKEKIAEQIPEYRRYVAGNKNVGLIFENKMLDEDSKPLSGYGIQHMSVVRLLLDFSGGESPAFHEGKEMEKDNTPTPKETQNLHLKFKEKTLDEDSKFLSEFGIQHKSVIHMMEVPEEQS